MKRFLLTVLSSVFACSALAQVLQPPKPSKSVVEAFFEIRDNAPEMAMRIGTYVQLARQCGIPDGRLKGAITHYEVYAALGDAQYKQALVTAFSRGMQQASRNPLSSNDCRNNRAQLEKADQVHADGARKLAGLVTHAQAVGGTPVQLPPNNPVSVPPGAKAPDTSNPRPGVPGSFVPR